jgi:hypothetical protein
MIWTKITTAGVPSSSGPKKSAMSRGKAPPNSKPKHTPSRPLTTAPPQAENRLSAAEDSFLCTFPEGA